MGLLRTAALGFRAHCAPPRTADACTGIRSNGSLAILADHDHHRNGRLSAEVPGTKSAVAVVTAALKHHDSNPAELAGRLLERFGSIAAITNASEDDLRQVELPGEEWVNWLVGARDLVLCGMRENVVRTNIHETRTALYEYLMATMGGLRHERLIAFFLDANGMVLSEEIMAEGGHGEVPVPMRRIIGRALSFDSAGVVLAHNHPSGASLPSASDIRNTKQLDYKMQGLGLRIVDHLIVAAGSITSLQDRGYL